MNNCRLHWINGLIWVEHLEEQRIVPPYVWREEPYQMREDQPDTFREYYETLAEEFEIVADELTAVEAEDELEEAEAELEVAYDEAVNMGEITEKFTALNDFETCDGS